MRYPKPRSVRLRVSIGGTDYTASVPAALDLAADVLRKQMSRRGTFAPGAMLEAYRRFEDDQMTTLFWHSEGQPAVTTGVLIGFHRLKTPACPPLPGGRRELSRELQRAA